MPSHGVKCGSPEEPCSCPPDYSNDSLLDVKQTRYIQMDAKPLAARVNNGKLNWTYVPFQWIEELVRIFTKGMVKYDRDNWMNSIGTEKSKEWRETCLNCAYRHIAKYRAGEIYDSEVIDITMKHYTGRNFTQEECDRFNSIKTTHMGHAMWNLGAVFFYDLMEGLLT